MIKLFGKIGKQIAKLAWRNAISIIFFVSIVLWISNVISFKLFVPIVIIHVVVSSIKREKRRKKLDKEMEQVFERYRQAAYEESLRNLRAMADAAKMASHGLSKDIVGKIKSVNEMTIRGATDGERSAAKLALERLLVKHNVTLNQII